MVRYVLNRLLMLIPVIIAVSFIVFALVELAPGDIVDTKISGDMTQDDIAALREQYNLDKSMFYRYGLYMLNLSRGDLGMMQQSGQPVFAVFMSRLPNTLILTFTSAVIGVALAIPMGILAARKAGTVTDTATTTFTLVGMSMPMFWLGLLLIIVFSMWLGWFPAGGNLEGVRSLVLPAVCSAMTLMAMSARQTRSSMLEVLKADFMRTARAKGVPEKKVIRKHALGNALIPIVTAVGASVCVQLAGSAVIEQVFAWPGIGRMLVEGMISRDTPVIIGCSILTTILYVVVMLIVDLLYAFIDPRIKSQYTRTKRKTKSAETSPPVPAVPSSHSPLGRGGREADGVVSPDPSVPLSPVPCISSPDPYTYSGARDFVTRPEASIIPGDAPDSASEVIARYKKRSQAGDIVHRLMRNKSSLIGIGILCIVFLIAIASLFMSYDSIVSANIPASFSPPSSQFPFGTDNMGRNAFLRVLYGSRYSLVVGFSSVFFAATIGVALGSIAAYFGGMTDNLIMRVSDILASLPGLLLGMVIMVMLGREMRNLIIAVGIAGIPHFIRIARASILTVKENEYVEASRAIGFGDLRIIATQVLPNGLSPILVQVTALLGLNIIFAASLSFLGFGIPPPIPEWGALVSAGREYVRTAPWLTLYPGLFIMITVLGFNLLGDGLRDALDPKLKK